MTQPIFKDASSTGKAKIKSIRTCIFLGKLNKLRIFIRNFENAYLEALAKEKVYIVAGPDFGEFEGCILIVKKALYGLRTSGARWAEQLADSLRNLEFLSSYADPAIWIREYIDYWKYICIWADDTMVILK